MITAYPSQMYIGSDLKLFSGSFVEISNAQLDNGNIVLVTNQENDQESTLENDQLREQEEETEEQEEGTEEPAAEQKEILELKTEQPPTEEQLPTEEPEPTPP